MFLHKKILSIFFFLFSSCVGLSCSVVFDSAIPWTIAHQAPLSVGFSRQEYQSGLQFPSPGDHPDPGSEPGSPALQADFNCLSNQGGILKEAFLIFPEQNENEVEGRRKEKAHEYSLVV